MVSTHLKNISQNGSFPQVGVKIKNNWNHLLFVSPFLVLLTIYCEISDLENSRNAIKAATKCAAVLGLGSLHVMSAPTCDGWKWHVHHLFAFWNYNCCQVKSDSTIRVKFCINNSIIHSAKMGWMWFCRIPLLQLAGGAENQAFLDCRIIECHYHYYHYRHPRKSRLSHA